MTAPRTLPGCPVCGREPHVSDMKMPHYAGNVWIECCAESRNGMRHNIVAIGKNMAVADARWRRLAGAGGEGK